MEILIITGMSGAGKTSVLNLCQDNGYYCVDNMPPKLIRDFLYLAERAEIGYTKLAFVVDVRQAVFNVDVSKEIEELRNLNYEVKILFIDAKDEILIKRYKEKRRPHPVEGDTIENSIKKERKYLEKLKKEADIYIDSSKYNLPRLKNSLDTKLFGDSDFNIQIISFGFKYGILSEADMVLDVRFIPNPFYVEELRERNGTEKLVSDYVLNNEISMEFLKKIEELINLLVPNYKKEGKSSLVIGIGCTGGKHRSPAMVEALKEKLNKNFSTVVFHRESTMW